MIQLLFFLAAKWRSLEAYKLSNSFVILGNCELREEPGVPRKRSRMILLEFLNIFWFRFQLW